MSTLTGALKRVLTSPKCRNSFAAIRTPPCGSPGLSLLCISYSSELGNILDEAILLSSNVSVPMIMPRSTSSMTIFSRFPFLLRLWKLIFKTLRFLTFPFVRLCFTFREEVAMQFALKLSKKGAVSFSVLVLLYLVE